MQKNAAYLSRLVLAAWLVVPTLLRGNSVRLSSAPGLGGDDLTQYLGRIMAVGP